MMNDWKRAKERCEKIIAVRPDYAEAYNNLAVLYDKQSDYANALKNYAKAVNLQPDYITAHHNLGLFFLKHEMFNEALIQFKNVIALNPDMLSAHYHLGNLYLGKNQLDLAEEHYQYVLTLQGEHSEVLSNLGVIELKKENPQLAIDYFGKSLAFDNNNQEARNNLAGTFMLHDRYENAITHYLELLTIEPNNREYHYNIAVAYMQLGHLNEAMVHFETVIENHPDHAASLNNLAAIFWRLGDPRKAENFFMRALAVEPENTTSRYMLTALRSKNDPTNANSEYQEHGAPADYVKNLFDNYAVQYDAHLCGQLQYQLPAKIGELLREYFFIHDDRRVVANIQGECLDLGCGTGLVGQYLKSYYAQLIGVDLSEKMLKNAEKTGFYDQLFCDEILHFFQDFSHSTKQSWDCICAAEVFEYLGVLKAIFQEISEHLKPQGLFIFSIEITEHADFLLQDTARFAHNPTYIHQLAKENGLKLLHEIPMTARLQNHEPLSSCLFFLEK